MKFDKHIDLDIIGIYLTLIFTAMQVCGVIEWEWWQLLLPIFICVAVGLIMIIVVATRMKNIKNIKRKFASDIVNKDQK